MRFLELRTLLILLVYHFRTRTRSTRTEPNFDTYAVMAIIPNYASMRRSNKHASATV